jgi:multiple sugar transport system ATP-binding protein
MATVLIDHVTKRYGGGGEVLAVKDLTLQCPDKKFLAIIGPSGCGKSSTLRMIAGLEEITEGEIYIGDAKVTKTKPKNLDLAMVFENYALYPHLNAYDNMALNLKVKRTPKAIIEQKVTEVASILEIQDILHMNINQLSSGQKQRVSLGRAIVRNPAVFTIDEPLSHVDVRVRINVRGELKKLFKQIEATVVYVTHNQEDAIALADKIAVMNFGELQQVGTATDLYERPQNTFVASFVGQPGINLVNGEFRRDGEDLRFTFNDSVVEIPLNMRARLLEKTVEKAILGLRPLYIQISNSGERQNKSDVVTGELTGAEYHGNFSVISVKMGEVVVRAQLSGFFKAKPGESISLKFDMNKANFFDYGTGGSLL